MLVENISSHAVSHRGNVTRVESRILDLVLESKYDTINESLCDLGCNVAHNVK